MRIAFCGIDGAGKTSLILQLQEKLLSIDKKGKIMKLQLNSQKILKRMAIDITGMEKNYLSIFPIQWGRIALGFEFYDYYRDIDKIQHIDYVLCDRFDICYKVYSKVYGVNDMYEIEKIFDLVPKPDLYVYLKVDVATALNRIEKRGEEKTFDEQECFLTPAVRYYDDYFSKIDSKVLILDATKNTDFLCDEIIDYIKGMER